MPVLTRMLIGAAAGGAGRRPLRPPGAAPRRASTWPWPRSPSRSCSRACSSPWTGSAAAQLPDRCPGRSSARSTSPATRATSSCCCVVPRPRRRRGAADRRGTDRSLPRRPAGQRGGGRVGRHRPRPRPADHRLRPLRRHRRARRRPAGRARRAGQPRATYIFIGPVLGGPRRHPRAPGRVQAAITAGIAFMLFPEICSNALGACSPGDYGSSSSSASAPSPTPSTPRASSSTRPGQVDRSSCNRRHRPAQSRRGERARATDAGEARRRRRGAPVQRRRRHEPARGRGVTKRFAGITALDDVSLRSTRARSSASSAPTARARPPVQLPLRHPAPRRAAGSAFGGQDLTGLPVHRRARLGIGRTFQRIELFAGMTVRDHLLVAERARRATAGSGGTS